MKSAPLSLLLVSLATLLLACGGDDTTGDTATTAASSGAGGGGTDAQANGCTAYTDATDVAFTFTQYTPNCAKVKAGGTVTFTGDFVGHPLQGGAATASMGMADASSPIGHTDTGMEKAITFPTAGVYGYYCTVHVGVGMRGAVKVE